MNKRSLRLGMLLNFALACGSVFAQSMQIHVYGTSDGLPQSEVVSIYQDRVGFMWFGTYENGLARYDGRTFQRLMLPGGIPNGAVREIFQDRHDSMWIGTEEGLICLRPNPEKGDSAVSVFMKNHGLPDNNVTSILQDTHGVLWIGTEGGVCYFENNAFVARLSQRSPQNNVIISMALAPDGSVWMGTQDGVNIWRGDSLRTLTTAEGLPSNWIRAVFCDRDGAMWIGTQEGLARFINNSLQRFDAKDGLFDTNIYALAQDQQGYLWIGARTGLSRLDLTALPQFGNGKPHAQPAFRHFDRRHGLSVDRIATLFVDYENNLWMGTWGGGACKFRLGSTYIENYSPLNGLPTASVYSFLEDSRGRIWIGTNGGGLAIVQHDSLMIRDTGSGLPNNVVHALAREPSGAIWIGTHGGAVRIPSERFIDDSRKWQIFTTKNGLPADGIRNIFCAPSGEVWLATSSAGAVRFYEGTFTALTMQDGLPSNFVQAIHRDRQNRLWLATNAGLVLREGAEQKIFRRGEGLPVDFVISIFEDRAGGVWFGTRRGGAVRYTEGKFHVLSTANGLSDNVVYFITQDSQQRLWFGTNAGVDCFVAGDNGKLENQSITLTEDKKARGVNQSSTPDWAPFFHLAAKHGLADNECNTRAALCDRDGNLWFGTAGGATKLYPNRLPPVTPPPRIHIHSVEIGDRTYTGFADLHMEAKAKTAITFYFNTLSFFDEQNVSSQVYLEGFDNDWINLGNTNHVRYTNLSPGSYTFFLRGINAFGVPSIEAAQLRLKILPPFYRTWWFLFTCIIAFIGGAYSFHRLRVRQVHKHNEELQKVVEEKTRSLKEAHAFMSSIKDFLPVGLLVVNERRFVVEANRACAALFSSTPEALRNQELHNLLGSDWLTRDQTWAAMQEELSWRDLLNEAKLEPASVLGGVELVGLRQDGEKFPCLVHSCSVRDERGALRYVILTCENLAEWKELEQRLIENEKQLALVDLMAGMGDILNNKLAGIQGCLDLLKTTLTTGLTQRQNSGRAASSGDVATMMGWAQKSAAEMSTVLRQLFEFGASLAKVPVLPVDLRKILWTLERQWNSKLRFRLPNMPAPIPVKVIPKIKSGLGEAICNSLEADATEIDVHVETLPTLSRVRLTLTDNGRGVSPTLVNKVFLPFFKTKATPHPGLGLWKLRQLVQQSGGNVEILFIPQGGTQLVINLPMATLEQLSDDAAAQEAAVTECTL